jgi:hypothetical protein
VRWFGHVQGGAIKAMVRKSDFIQIERSKKGRERPKITLKLKSSKKKTC